MLIQSSTHVENIILYRLKIIILYNLYNFLCQTIFVFYSYLPGISTATAEIWKLFKTTIPLLFKDTVSLKDEKHIEKLGIIIEKCKEHSDIYVPPNGLSVDQYNKQLPHYKGKF